MRSSVAFADVPIQAHKYCLYNVRPAAEDGKWPSNVINYIRGEISDQLCSVRAELFDVPETEPIPCHISHSAGSDLRMTLLSNDWAVKSSARRSDLSATKTGNSPRHIRNDEIDIHNSLLFDIEDYQRLFSNSIAAAEQTAKTIARSNKSKQIDYYNGIDVSFDLFDATSEKPAEKTFMQSSPEHFSLTAVSTSTSIDCLPVNTPVLELVQGVYRFYPLKRSSKRFKCDIRWVNGCYLAIQPYDSVLSQEFGLMMDKLQIEVDRAPALARFDEKTPCIAYSALSKAWVRAIITECGDESVRCFFVDYFEWEWIDFKKVRYCDSKYMKLTLPYIEIKLWDVRQSPRADIKQLDNALYELLDNKPRFAKVINMTALPQVELYANDVTTKVIYDDLIGKGLLVRRHRTALTRHK